MTTIDERSLEHEYEVGYADGFKAGLQAAVKAVEYQCIAGMEEDEAYIRAVLCAAIRDI